MKLERQDKGIILKVYILLLTYYYQVSSSEGKGLTQTFRDHQNPRLSYNALPLVIINRKEQSLQKYGHPECSSCTIENKCSFFLKV